MVSVSLQGGLACKTIRIVGNSTIDSVIITIIHVVAIIIVATFSERIVQ